MPTRLAITGLKPATQRLTLLQLVMKLKAAPPLRIAHHFHPDHAFTPAITLAPVARARSQKNFRCSPELPDSTRHINNATGDQA